MSSADKEHLNKRLKTLRKELSLLKRRKNSELKKDSITDIQKRITKIQSWIS